jgi:HEPN domain-containing protein
MKGDKDVAHGWLRKADSDLANAKLCLAAGEALDTACFHCQQAAEKALKAYLIAKNVEFPHIHDLKRLLDHCSRIDPSFDALTAAALCLNPFAVATRYDDAFWPETEEVQNALELAMNVQRFVLERFP